MQPKIIIVGGGLAGLAAAVALTDRGFPCTLLESRARLGGRASSFHDSTTNSDIDNCQHVTLGCCTNYRHFCQTTGMDRFFRREPTLFFIGPGGKLNRFAAGPLPAPFHLTGAFAKLSYLSWKDKWTLGMGLRALTRTVSSQDESQPFSEWLKRHRQTETTIKRFWHVVLVSALSESLDRISVTHARKVFIDAFLANRDGWYVDIPIVPLEELYGHRLTDWLKSRGTQIRFHASAEQLNLDDQKITGVRLTAGEILTGDEFIVALPFYRTKSVLPERVSADPALSGIDRLESAPISSIHLWFDRPITELPHAVFVDRVCQWVFNRSIIAGGGRGNTHSFYYQIVVSASHDLLKLEKDEILQIVLQELIGVWPDTAQAKLLHSRQITEHRAVFSPVPAVDTLRPYQQSPIGNLQLAGDWTATGWPATMEGAVRSGYLAAQNVCSRLGRTDKILQPDLKTSVLSKILFGIQ